LSLSNVTQVAKKDRLQLYDICDYRALAMALVKKCTLTIPSLYDGERNQPWNIIPEFGGAPPAADKIKWHGRPDYDFLLPDIDDPVKLTGRFPARVNLVEWPLLASQPGIVVADTILPHLFYHFFCVPVVRRQLGRLHVHAADSGTLWTQRGRPGLRRSSADVSPLLVRAHVPRMLLLRKRFQYTWMAHAVFSSFSQQLI
jgi:hypothetical protein